MSHPHPQIAIVSPNTLMCIGLRHLLQHMMPQVEVNLFNTFTELICDTPDFYAHYFVTTDVLLEHTLFFREKHMKTIVMTNGMTYTPQLEGFHTLNMCLHEDLLVKQLLQLQQSAHHNGRQLPQEWKMNQHMTHEDPNGLSAREIEVLVWMVRGYINKQIAEKMGIAVTTVISHRKNIMTKTGIRSLAALTIYAVMNGYIEADRI